MLQTDRGSLVYSLVFAVYLLLQWHLRGLTMTAQNILIKWKQPAVVPQSFLFSQIKGQRVLSKCCSCCSLQVVLPLWEMCSAVSLNEQIKKLILPTSFLENQRQEHRSRRAFNASGYVAPVDGAISSLFLFLEQCNTFHEDLTQEISIIVDKMGSCFFPFFFEKTISNLSYQSDLDESQGCCFSLEAFFIWNTNTGFHAISTMKFSGIVAQFSHGIVLLER